MIKVLADFSLLLIFNRHHVSETVLKVSHSVRKVNSLSKILIKEFLLVKFPSILLANFGSRNFY